MERFFAEVGYKGDISKVAFGYFSGLQKLPKVILKTDSFKWTSLINVMAKWINIPKQVEFLLYFQNYGLYPKISLLATFELSPLCSGNLTNIFTMDWVTDYACPDLSPPKPLDQSKNVTARSYHKLSKDQNGRKKLAKKFQKVPKEPKYV